MTVSDRVRESAVSVLESDFADDRETVAALRRRRHPRKPLPPRKLRRRKSR